jgi:hypothetical protein
MTLVMPELYGVNGLQSLCQSTYTPYQQLSESEFQVFFFMHYCEQKTPYENIHVSLSCKFPMKQATCMTRVLLQHNNGTYHYC